MFFIRDHYELYTYLLHNLDFDTTQSCQLYSIGFPIATLQLNILLFRM